MICDKQINNNNSIEAIVRRVNLICFQTSLHLFLLSQTVSQNVMFASLFYNQYNCQREFREAFWWIMWHVGPEAMPMDICQVAACQKTERIKHKSHKSDNWTVAVTLWVCSGCSSQHVAHVQVHSSQCLWCQYRALRLLLFPLWIEKHPITFGSSHSTCYFIFFFNLPK